MGVLHTTGWHALQTNLKKLHYCLLIKHGIYETDREAFVTFNQRCKIKVLQNVYFLRRFVFSDEYKFSSHSVENNQTCWIWVYNAWKDLSVTAELFYVTVSRAIFKTEEIRTYSYDHGTVNRVRRERMLQYYFLIKLAEYPATWFFIWMRFGCFTQFRSYSTWTTRFQTCGWGE